MTAKLSFSVVARITASVLLFWALSRHPYGYYTLMRWAVCGATSYCAYLSITFKQIPWAWAFGLIALLFNPLIPARIDRATWAYLDVIAGIFLLLSIYFVRESLHPKEGPNV